MKKKQEPQLLFKFLQSSNYSIETKEKKLDLDEIQQLNKESVLFELIIEDQDLKLTAQISQQFEQFNQLIYLGLNKCNIRELINIPLITSLRRLTLDYNYIDNHELKYLSYYNNTLISLSLAENELDFTINTWKDQIGGMIELVQLTISGNKFVQPEEDQNRNDSLKIRDLLFDMLPKLRFLDCIEKGKNQHTISHFKSLKEETEYLARFEFISDLKKHLQDSDNSNSNNNNNNNNNNNDNDDKSEVNQKSNLSNEKQDQKNEEKQSDESSAEVQKVIKKKKNKAKGKNKGTSKQKKNATKEEETGQEKIKKQVKVEPQIQEPTRRSSRIRGKNE